jgi:hypothetical protein
VCHRSPIFGLFGVDSVMDQLCCILQPPRSTLEFFKVNQAILPTARFRPMLLRRAQ